MKKHFIVSLLILVLLLICLAGCKQEATLVVLDVNGAAVENAAYVQVVHEELEAFLMTTMGITRERAAQALKTKNFTVHTAYDPAAAKALEDACKAVLPDTSAGCALTDLEGNLVAVYSSGAENYALRRCSPYGTLTPLSVYTPAIARKVIQWNTLFEDSGYMLIDDGNGSVRSWPGPSGEDYTFREYYAYQALRKPLNTVTVRILAALEPANAVTFLQQSFAMDLTTEKQEMDENGGDAILSDLVFGYLAKGVTPVDMAGYYQVFANGGKYAAPAAVLRIEDESGNTLYVRESGLRQAMDARTADMMNLLLRGVVAPGGTGAKAAVKDLQVAGKTGSGGENNWFVGVTPGYSLAVWHGGTGGNRADQIFARAAETLHKDTADIHRSFITHTSLQKYMICAESGQGVSAHCSQIEIGYFDGANVPDVCDRHGIKEEKEN